MLSTKKISIAFLFIGLGFSSMSQKLLTLEQTLEIAYVNSPDIIMQKLSLEQSQENLKAQRAAMKSRFAFDVEPLSYSNNRSYSADFQEWRNYSDFQSSGTFSVRQPIVATDGTVTLSNRFGYQSSALNDGDAANTFSNNLQLRIDQPILSYNSIKMTLETLELNLENTMMSFAMQKLNIERSVTQLFYNVYSQQQSLNIAKEEFKNQQKSYEIIKNKVDAGLVAKEELWQAELNLANAKSSVYNSEVSLENSKDNLKKTVGMPLDEDFNVLSNVEVQTVNVALPDAIDYALKQRMELRQRQINIQTAQFELIRTKDNNKFKGNVGLSVGLQGIGDGLGSMYNTPRDNENISLSFEIPIWDWGQRKAQIRSSEISIEQAEINLEQEKINIEINIRQVYRNLINLANQIEIAKKSAVNAERTYELKVEEYENGDLTSMDLSLYQNQLSSSKNDLTGALINYKIELLNLKIQTLWDFEKRISILPKNIYSAN